MRITRTIRSPALCGLRKYRQSDGLARTKRRNRLRLLAFFPARSVPRKPPRARRVRAPGDRHRDEIQSAQDRAALRWVRVSSVHTGEHMQRAIAVITAFLSLLAGTASAQNVKDVRSVLEASLQAMGGAKLKTIRYSANGWSSRIGQTYGLAEDWPHYEVAGYTRVIDYDAKWSREDYTRRQGKYPLLGRPPMPEEHVTAILGGNYAWDMQGSKPVPLTSLYLDAVSYADLRQLEIVLTPEGFLKAAMAASDAKAISLNIVGAS